MPSALTLAQYAANRLQLPTPDSFVNSSDNNMVLLKRLFEATLQELKDKFPWPELEREYTFTLSTSTASYALPGDFDSRQFGTEWNRTQHWPLIGPIDAIEWQQYKSGFVTSFPRQRFRVKGAATSQFFIDPTPTSSENGQTLVYEYISRNTIRPKTWVASTTWSGIQYCFYNGNYYDRGVTTAATTGTTAPTHTSGSVSDGSITWTYISTPFEVFTNDTDEVVLDYEMVLAETIWRYKRENGMEYEDFRRDAEAGTETAMTKLAGAGVLNVNGSRLSAPMIGPWSYPTGNFNF